MNIFFSCDDNFEILLNTCIASILTNSRPDEDFSFFILDGGISDRVKNNIEELKRIKPFTIEYLVITNEDFVGCSIHKDAHQSLATFYRYKMCTLKPKLDRILYIDADMIVRTSLSELYNTDLEGHVLGAVADTGNKHVCGHLKLNPSHHYFNAGMLLIDCKKWHEQDVEKKLFDITKERHDDLRFNDQDVFNILFENDYKLLPLKWNVVSANHYFKYSMETFKKQFDGVYSEEEMKRTIENPGIVHFIGRPKPSVKGCLSEFAQEFLLYSIMTSYRVPMIGVFLWHKYKDFRKWVRLNIMVPIRGPY